MTPSQPAVRIVPLRLLRSESTWAWRYVFGSFLGVAMLVVGLVMTGVISTGAISENINVRSLVVVAMGIFRVFGGVFALMRELGVLPAVLIVRLRRRDIVFAFSLKKPLGVVKSAQQATVASVVWRSWTWTPQQGSHEILRYRWCVRAEELQVVFTMERPMSLQQSSNWTAALRAGGFTVEGPERQW